jgi:hypothetical protein
MCIPNGLNLVGSLQGLVGGSEERGGGGGVIAADPRRVPAGLGSHEPCQGYREPPADATNQAKLKCCC